MAEHGNPPPALAKRGITKARDNLNPGDRVVVPVRRIVDGFFDEIRAHLQKHMPPAPPPTPKPKPKARQQDLPGIEHPALYDAYLKAGLSRHLPYEKALADPATRQCLEIMAKEES